MNVGSNIERDNVQSPFLGVALPSLFDDSGRRVPLEGTSGLLESLRHALEEHVGSHTSSELESDVIASSDDARPNS